MGLDVGTKPFRLPCPETQHCLLALMRLEYGIKIETGSVHFTKLRCVPGMLCLGRRRLMHSGSHPSNSIVRRAVGQLSLLNLNTNAQAKGVDATIYLLTY